ncbi:glycosyltransferase involved in cell wall biosynthesis [Rhizobium sp. SG_E_25_P2]|uniref:glycoside hydrolase family 99-like domain-containing protein n=1 Tax=Rhizobium sp. SG_E_25_P2 TaxID=2879942 RepID=UPI0024744C7B|nr:glycoside hydrolase family 99-like domain-containing protein [Rhizobium sp. SG_E_25_P2]MDH6265084.1 glycosyltransferase involved in cell wall biosynthesis [Rhizobium sp. SG_E_25_P2]
MGERATRSVARELHALGEQDIPADFRRLLLASTAPEMRFDADFFRASYKELLKIADDTDNDELLARYIGEASSSQLSPNPHFNEAGYLRDNADVVDAVRGKQFACGFHHWLLGGFAEERTGWNMPHIAPQQTRSAKAVRRRVRIAPARALSSFDLSNGLNGLSAEQMRDVLVETGLFDRDLYLSWYPDLRSVDCVDHYVAWGFKEGRIVSPFFDDNYYKRSYPEVLEFNGPPLIHYLLAGAKKGYNPHILLNTSTYSSNNSIDLNESNPLIHYALAREKRGLIDTPHFDYDYYTGRHPDAATFAGGPLLHFLYFGVYVGYKPSPTFNTLYYSDRYLNRDLSRNAYLHYLEVGRQNGYATYIPDAQTTIAREVAKFTNPGEQFENLDTSLARGERKRARLIAFYLPQFHTFPENDEWWGKGFTEWRNLPRAIPRFAGHYQPRIPRDLSFYNLEDPAVMRRQVQMAMDMGLWAFCFYFYWFNRHRLMEKPLDAFRDDKSLNMPFMILWANENWTRRWDGADQEILIQQDQLPEDDEALVDCLQSYFSDARYVRIGGRPLLVVYRADIIKDSQSTLDRWRAIFKDRHNEEPLFFLAQTFLAEDPNKYGFDGAIEFPPHKLANFVADTFRNTEILDWEFEGSVLPYPEVIDVSLNETPPSFPLAKTVCPSWDNSSRRKTGALVFDGATPQLFGRWLDGAIDYSRANPVLGENIVFINAWNEWCESAYLEPDVHYGGAVLNELARTISAPEKAHAGDKHKILLVGHDAFPAGAQRNLVALATTLQNQFGLEIEILLLGGGALLETYQSLAPTIVCDQATIDSHLYRLKSRGFAKAIVNTVVSGRVLPNLKAFDFEVVSLVHELPDLITEYRLKDIAADIARESDFVVFASATVRDAFVSSFGECSNETVIRPQGIYHVFDRDDAARKKIRDELALDEHQKLIINVGYGDIRKGIDLFLQTAILSFNRGSDTQFVWVGGLHPQVGAQIQRDIVRTGITNLHLVGERSEVKDFMNAADAFLLTSREDPFPSVLLEAMQIGLPIVAYEDNGGYVDLLRADKKLGSLVSQGDTEATLEALDQTIAETSVRPALIQHRIDKARRDFDFVDYAFGLVKLVKPELKKVSVIVPSYNYEAYVKARLRSIFTQTYPIYELIILDDASTDNSVQEIMQTLAGHARIAKVVASSENSGSAFAQWERGARLATGELVWIAEADDLSEPVFLETMVEAHTSTQDCAFSFTDSLSIDSDGFRVYDSYIPYAESIAQGLLLESRTFSGFEFAKEALGVANLVLNVSSILWNSEALKSALQDVEDDMSRFRLVGDWRLYLAASNLGRQVAYVASPLNIHRRHQNSITTSMDIDAHLAEIEAIHQIVGRAGRNRADLKKAQAAYRTKTRRWLEAN